MVIARKKVMERWPRGAHGNTFGGNPICCAAALATLELVEGGFARNAGEQGLYFMQRLRELAARHEVIGDVRGKGLMIGMELVSDQESKAPAKELAQRVIERAFHNGLLLLTCGASTIRFMPPLLVSRENIEEAMTLLEVSLDEAK
jgi:4-aminobutyrate aminotransferase